MSKLGKLAAGRWRGRPFGQHDLRLRAGRYGSVEKTWPRRSHGSFRGRFDSRSSRAGRRGEVCRQLWSNHHRFADSGGGLRNHRHVGQYTSLQSRNFQGDYEVDRSKGKKVGISRFGSGTDTAIRLICKKFGLDPVKDLVIIQGGTQPSRLQALLAGSLDATLVSPPLDLKAKKQGLTILVNIAELAIPYPQLVIETTDRFVRENPREVKSFLKGFLEGVFYTATHKEETKKLITKYLKESDPEILEATYQSFLQVTDYSANPNLDGLRNAIEEVGARVPAAKSKRPEEFIDTRFLRDLEKEGFFKQFQKRS